MIQSLTTAYKIFIKSKVRNEVTLNLISLILFLFLLYKYHLKDDLALNSLLNNILQFSSIFTALLISFIISKVFQVKQEKLNRLNEIKVLSNKTTDFRRICKILYDKTDFWDKTMRQKLDKKYKNLSYFDLYLDIPKTDQKEKLIEDYLKDHQKQGATFFLGIRSLLTETRKSFHLELYDDYDHNITYPLELVEKWYGADSANCFWYYLENKWHNYSTAFNFSALNKHDKNQIVLLSKKINPKKYKSATFDKDLLVSIGNDFQGNLFPRLYSVTYYNSQGIPKSLNFLIKILMATMVFGVFIPMWLSSIIIDNFKLKIIISNFSIIVLSMCIVYFVLNFKKTIEREIEITREYI